MTISVGPVPGNYEKSEKNGPAHRKKWKFRLAINEKTQLKSPRVFRIFRFPKVGLVLPPSFIWHFWPKKGRKRHFFSGNVLHLNNPHSLFYKICHVDWSKSNNFRYPPDHDFWWFSSFRTPPMKKDGFGKWKNGPNFWPPPPKKWFFSFNWTVFLTIFW